MRGLSEIRRQNREWEERERRGDFDEDPPARACRKCGHYEEDCKCPSPGIQRAHDQGGPKPAYIPDDIDPDYEWLRCNECGELDEACRCRGTTQEELNGA